MSAIYMLMRPDQLEIGRKYWLRESTAYEPLPRHVEVTFVGYDSCPAFVFVRDPSGYVGRCARSDLFSRSASVMGRM